MTNNLLLDKVRQLLREQIQLPDQAHLLVALSGGADSVALLYVLQQLREEFSMARLAAIHIHHGLRGEEADRDEAIAKSHCERCGVPFYTHHVDVAAVAQSTHCGLEEAGRVVRYRLFQEVMDSEGFTHLATAHTQNDNTETVLLHLTRGTSVAGLRGIPVVRGQFIRPLLTCTRDEIETYCAERSLYYGMDSTNADIAFARNRIRNCVVPSLYTVNPRLHEAVYRLGVMATEDEAYWCAAVEEVLQKAQKSPGIYDIAVLSNLPIALRRRVVYCIIAEHNNECEERHVRAVLALLDKGGTTQVGGGVMATIQQGMLTIGVDPAVVEERVLRDGAIYQFGNTHYRAAVWDRSTFENYQNVHKILLQYTCDYDKIKGVAFVRGRREGDVCNPYRRGGCRSLKKWMNAEKIPAAIREHIPVVADEEGVVLVVGLGCDARAAIDETTKNILIFFEINEGSDMYAQ